MKKLHVFLQKLVLLAIRLYQAAFSPFGALFPTAGCRFWPSCSEYTHEAIRRHGVMKGVRMGAARIFKCNPWNS